MSSYIDKIDKATEKVKEFNKGIYGLINDIDATKNHCDQIRDNMACWANAKEYAEKKGGSAYDRAMNFSEYVYDHDPNYKYDYDD